MADYRKTLEARRNRRRGGPSSQAARESAGDVTTQPRGGFGIAPGGRKQGGDDGGIGEFASKFGPKLAKAGKNIWDIAQGDRQPGGRSQGLSEQRVGEADRSSFSAPPAFAMPEFNQTMNVGPSSPMSQLDVLRENLPGVDASSLVGGMDAGGMASSLPAQSGAGTGVGSTAAGGIGGLVGMGAGMLPGLIGRWAGADPTTVGVLNAVGSNVLGPAAGGAAAGLAGGAGGAAAGTAGAAGAGAAGGLAGAAAGMMFIGPKVGADLIKLYQAGWDHNTVDKLTKRVQNIGQQFPGLLEKLGGIPGIAGKINRNSSPEQASDVLRQLNAIQKDFQDNGWESHMKQGATTMTAPQSNNSFSADLDGLSRTLIEATDRYFPQMDLARLRAQDIMERGGYDSERIKQETGRYVSPQEWAQNMGTNLQYFDQESGSRDVRARSYNPYLTENFQKPGQARDAAAIQQADMEAQMRAGQGEYVGANPNSYRPAPGGGMWSDEANAAFGQFKPGETEKGLSDLFGGQFADAYQGMGVGGGPGAGAIPGSEIGGAGKRSPQFITPELDNRAEAGTGKLGGGMRPGQPGGQPFGMRPGSGGMQVGGGPRGNAPFGGMRPGMQPQAGQGVQAQRRSSTGVV